MDEILESINKFLNLFSKESKQYKIMKNILFLSLVLTITFRIIDFSIGVSLNFNLTKPELASIIFTKLTLISLFTFVFCYGFIKGLITYYLPTFFLNRKINLSDKLMEKTLNYKFSKNIIQKLNLSKNLKKISRYILEPYVYLIMFLFCFKLSITILFLLIIAIVMLFSAGNIISIYNNHFNNKQ